MSQQLGGAVSQPDMTSIDFNTSNLLEVKAGGITDTKITAPLKSATLAAGATNNYILSTNGTNNSWISQANAVAAAMRAGPFYFNDFMDGAVVSWTGSATGAGTAPVHGSDAGANGILSMVGTGAGTSKAVFADASNRTCVQASTNTQSIFWMANYTSMTGTHFINLTDAATNNYIQIQLATGSNALVTGVGGVGKLNQSFANQTANAYHLYQLDWSTAQIVFSVDGTALITDNTAGDIPSAAMFPTVSVNNATCKLDYIQICGNVRG